MAKRWSPELGEGKGYSSGICRKSSCFTRLWNGFFYAREGPGHPGLPGCALKTLFLFCFRIDEIAGDYAEYFLKHFPALTIYVYNCLHQHPEYSHLVDIQDPPL